MFIATHRSDVKYRHSSWIFMKLELSRQTVKIYSNKCFMKIRPVGAEFLPGDGRTDRRDEANSRFSQLYERA